MSIHTTEEIAPHVRDSADRQRELGQFFTPAPIADFMAAMFSAKLRDVNLLDAGAGAGALSAAVVRRYCAQVTKPVSITITAYELDSDVVPRLRQTLADCARVCEAAGIHFAATLHNGDFIASVVPTVRGELFSAAPPQLNAAIVNPPYRKIRSDSATRQALSSAGIETSNLYTGFLSLIIRLLAPGGELVAITPRSFCNGPYFRPFREQFLDSMSVRRLHVFESRSTAFSDDEVLQENIVFHAIKNSTQPKQVVISTSSGDPSDTPSCRTVKFADVVSPNDLERFIHLVTSHEDKRVRKAVATFSASLNDLGLSVSTGRVVDFRARQYLRKDPAPDTAPLIYPSHFNGGFVHWPKPGRKPNAIISAPETADLLVPSGVYVLVKRFTTKEERRRIVACIFDPAHVPAPLVGFENHLNYFHGRGRGLDMQLAKGLAAFLNSTMVDNYFRQFNGHTQVNATDLRSLKYPSKPELLALGAASNNVTTDQREIDLIVEKELNARA